MRKLNLRAGRCLLCLLLPLWLLACNDPGDDDTSTDPGQSPGPTEAASPTPATPSPEPSSPTPEPETPTSIPSTPTPAPETPTPLPETPTSLPETPTSIPETPSPTPDPRTVDDDGDGFVEAPVDPSSPADCDDTDPGVFPGALEHCDGIDQDCDGTADDNALEATPWYLDADGDGYGQSDAPVTACDAPDGYAPLPDDCDDADPAYHPNAREEDCTDPNDYNCDGAVGYADLDADGFPACTECDDTAGDINPEATEVCDLEDNDCDGTVDEPDAADATDWYADPDQDGWGDAADTTPACSHPEGYAAQPGDCDPADPAVFPGALEVCNLKDDDCDALIDDADPEIQADPPDGTPTWYADADGDGYGDVATATTQCTAPAGYVGTWGDCDDQDPARNPDTPWYQDADGDGYGNPAAVTRSCRKPTGYVADDTDCDDGSSTRYPGADELCNALDDDCDGQVDLPAPVDGVTYLEDGDGDGFGDPESTTLHCDGPPPGYVEDDGGLLDCDDGDPSIYPGAAASCPGGESCLEVLDHGLATDSGDFWILPPGAESAQEVFCHFGPVGDGWTHRRAFTIENRASSLLSEYQVLLEVDTAALIAAGQLEPDAADLRFATHDGPLLRYWIESGLNEARTRIWLRVPTLPANQTSSFTMLYGNPDTEGTASAPGEVFVRDIPNLQGAWSFDESGWSGAGSVKDSSGSGYHGTPNGGMTPVAGRFGNAAGFDGSNDYISASSSAGNFGTGPFTVLFWTKLAYVCTSFPIAKGAVFDAGGNTRPGWSMGYACSPQAFYGLVGNGTTHIEYRTPWREITAWTLIGMAREADGRIVYLQNGQRTVSTFSLAGNVNNTKPLTFGWEDYYNKYLSGQIDEVRIYDRALSAQEVADQYGSSGNRYGYVSSSLPHHELVRQHVTPEPVAALGD